VILLDMDLQPQVGLMNHLLSLDWDQPGPVGSAASGVEAALIIMSLWASAGANMLIFWQAAGPRGTARVG
jgi:ABC-type sugar transport system permease subunit